MFIITVSLSNVSAYAAGDTCSSLIGKKGKIDNITFDKQLGFSMIINTVSDDGKK